MANILLNDFCNLKCSYCFANNLSESKNNSITFENFKTAVDFIATGKNESIGLMGGEPTLHPQFSDFLKYLDERDDLKDITIITNGSLINRFLDELSSDKFSMLINCNGPSDIGEDNYNILKNNIAQVADEKKISNRVVLGLNVYDKNMDYKFIFQLLKDNGLKKLRLSVTVPNSMSTCDGFDFYQEMTPLMMEIIFHALGNDIVPFLDCNQIPSCLVTNNDRQKMIKLSKGKPITNILSICESCSPVIDILPDLSVVRCLGLSDFHSTKLSEFHNIIDLRNYFKTQFDDFKNIIPTNSQCSNCQYNKVKRCSGGCLIYKMDKIINTKKLL